MRGEFVTTVERLMASDDRLFLLLGDIGVHGFRRASALFPGRVLNIGILEQASISVAAGLAQVDFIPVFHTIAPFLVERCLEQIKIDFCYQRLGGNLVSVGASYDYAALGCTHHCPADVGILMHLPGMEIVVPGTAAEFATLFQQSYDDGRITYFRLSEQQHRDHFPVTFGEAQVIRSGKDATVLAVGPMLGLALEAARDLDVSILYYATVLPFDAARLRDNASSNRVLVLEPFYEGTLAALVAQALAPRSIRQQSVGVPRRLLTGYGRREDHDQAIGLEASRVRQRLFELIDCEE